MAAVLVASACDDASPGVDPLGEKPPGATAHTITSADGTELNARLWERDAERLVIYLHEYLSDQSLWWPHIDARDAREERGDDGGGDLPPVIASALTIDLRGHGESEGEVDDLEGILRDAGAAVAWARDRGYEQITLAGSGMGAAVALKVAHEHPGTWVIGLSAPSEFGELHPLSIAPALADRLALVASEGDLSAAHSLELFVEATDLPPERWLLLGGRAHGVELLTAEGFEAARAFFLEMLSESWAAR